MIPPFAIAAGLAAAAYFFFKDDDEQPGVPSNQQQPVFSSEQKGSIAITRKTITGGTVMNFRSALIPAIMLRLENRGLVFQGGAGGNTNVFSIGAKGADSAAEAIASARTAGQVVLASYSIADPSAPSQLITLTTRELADLLAAPGPENAYAVLLAPDGWLLEQVVDPTNPSSPPTDPGESAGGIDDDLPLDVRANVLKALNDPNADPDFLELMADGMDAGGKFKTADALRRRAAEIRENNKLTDATRGGTPFRIRNSLDQGATLAQYYTGIANRWRELPAANKALGMSVRKHKNGFEFLDPWKVGMEILLPLSWNARSKSPMPSKGNGGTAPNLDPIINTSINWGKVLEEIEKA